MRDSEAEANFAVHDAARYIDAVSWKFASTMPDWPHEYTVKEWRPELATQFKAFCSLIRRVGTVLPWPPPPDRPVYHNRYLEIGPYVYWAMGSNGDGGPVNALTVVNRADRQCCSTTHSPASLVRDPLPVDQYKTNRSEE
ncbi:MAG: hypothetical protein DLM57_09880 [Pseudonocardiales bacterium]|nr:MAG: hypothetical protein DLM57_09880 [Pseudonocardiales bacterium]